MSKRIAVIGSLNIDNATYTKNPPVFGKTLYGESFISNLGGKGANQALAIYFLGGDVLFFGAKGKDANGDMASTILHNYGLKFYLKRVDSPTGVANIIINSNTGENSIIIVQGANLCIDENDVNFWMPKLKECNMLITQFETPIDTTMYAIKRAKEEGLITILNPAPYHDFDKKNMVHLDYFIPNEHELDDFAGDFKGTVIDKAKLALSYGCKNVIVTLGEKGSLLVNNDGAFEVKAHKVNAVDTTGAGDSYIGAFAKALMDGKTVIEAMEFASYCSSLTVQKRGAIQSLPHLEDL